MRDSYHCKKLVTLQIPMISVQIILKLTNYENIQTDDCGSISDISGIVY